MDNSIVGLVGGIIGCLGGAIGTYFSIRNTKTAAERRFMVRASVWIWLGVTLYLVILFQVPPAWRWVIYIPYAILVPIAALYINRRQSALREAGRE